MERSIGAGAAAPASSRTLRDYFERDYLPRRLVGRSGRSVTLYRHSIKLFGRYLDRDATLADLDDLTVAAYLQSLCDQGYSKPSVNKERRQLVALWNAAAKRRLVEAFPDVAVLPEPEIVPAAWTQVELVKISEACRRQPGEYFGVSAGDWWLAKHLVLWDTAERINAVCQLRWADIRGDWVTFRAETRKAGRKASVKRLRGETLQALDRIRTSSELVFPWPFCNTYRWRVYSRILKRAGVCSDRYSKFHRMRRSVASHLTAAGANATAALGHANAATTRAYLDPTIAKAVQPSDVLPSITEQES